MKEGDIMTLPVNLILLRHGYSESNLVQKKDELGHEFEVPDAFFQRHDSFARLAELGVDQARLAGDWFRENGYVFDKFYTSPHLRARETAANLRLNGSWTIDDLWRERDWGEYGMNPDRAVQEESFPQSALLRSQNLWYWKPAGGESLATGVRYRANQVLNILEKSENTSVIGVTHGEFIRVMQFVIERMTPEEWIKTDEDKDLSVKNCMVTHYSRVNPVTSELYYRYKWVKRVNTFDPASSPYGGEWQELNTTHFSDDDLMATVELYPRLFGQATSGNTVG